jgi:hypothetical protein
LSSHQETNLKQVVAHIIVLFTSAKHRSTSPLLPKQPDPSTRSPWSCAACTFENAATSADCNMCGAVRQPPSPKCEAPIPAPLPVAEPALSEPASQPRPIEFASFQRGRETVYVKIIENSGPVRTSSTLFCTQSTCTEKYSRGFLVFRSCFAACELLYRTP